MSRDFHEGSRSVAYGSKAMVATSHPIASLAARDCLQNGGNAIDAAIVASAVLCVVEPQSTGIGGDCFALIRAAGKEITGFNGSGYAGSKANVELLAKNGDLSIDATDAAAVTVPGAIDAWDQLLNDFGTISLGEALRPAQKIAEQGFVVLPRVAADWADAAPKLNQQLGGGSHALKNGRAPFAGEYFKFPALAKSFARLIEFGRDEFYKGEIAKDIIGTLDERGGLLTLEDLADYKGEYVTPITGHYKGHEIVEIPPNGHGVTALILLNILAKFDMKQYAPGSAMRYHLHMEAARFAYALRDEYVADPKFSNVPVDGLLSDAVASDIAAKISLTQKVDAHILPKLASSDTIYLSVADEKGNVISFINSTFEHFGTGIITENTGIALQCRGAGFSLVKGHPNQIEPRKRPMHTIIPAMLLRDGELLMSFGVMGGAYQPCGHAFFISNILDYGMDIQQAINFPRIFMDGQRLGIEKLINQETRLELKKLGHDIFEIELPWGGAQAVEIMSCPEGGLLFKGGSDPRKDGVALGC